MDLTFILELVGLFLTLMVLLYLFIGDNALFRIVTYSFIGITAGYITILVLFQVLLPRLGVLVRSGNTVYMGLGLIPFLLGLLLFSKLSPRLSRMGTIPMGILVGIGAAVTVGGAVFGTLAGQIRGTISLFHTSGSADTVTQLLEGVFVLVGTIATLAYFQFSVRSRGAVPVAAGAAPGADAETAGEGPARRDLFMDFLSKIGQVFIGIVLGATFAGVYTAAISALLERIAFIFNVIMSFLS
jgi:hypothetical protein